MAASGTVCFEVLASAQAALAEILGPENVSRGLPEATAEAVLAKMTDLFVQLVRETAAETAGQPGARRTGPGAASAATGVPRANFGAQPEPDNRDLPEPEKSHLEANPTGEVQVQVVTVTAGNKAATWTGSLRPGTGQAAWEGELQAHAKVFGKMNADAPGSDQLAVAAGSIVAEHHQGPPVDQSAEASPEAREYSETYRLIVAAVARVLHDGGNARAPLSSQRRRQLATNLSYRLSRYLGTRAPRSAAPIGAGRDRHGNYTPSDSAGAGPSRTTRIPATAPDQATSSRTGAQPGTVRHRDANSSDEERGPGSRRIRPRLFEPPGTGRGHPAPAAGLPGPSREMAGLVDSLRRDTRPIPPREQVVPGLGPDLFGSRKAPSAPDFLHGVQQDEFAPDQVVPFFRGISMTNATRPAVRVLRQDKLRNDPETITTAFFPGQRSNDPLQPTTQRSRVPKLAVAIWLGGPPDLRRPEWRGLEGIRRALGPRATMVLLTDVPRVQVEAARRAGDAGGHVPAVQPSDRDGAERARRLALTGRLLEWAVVHEVLLVNVDEISYKDQELTLDDAYRAELARHTGYGYARASDILRFSFAERFGTLLYTDWDNAVHSEFQDAQAGALLNSLEQLFMERGYALEIEDDGKTGNAAFTAGFRHPFPTAVLRQIRARYTKTQSELYRGAGLPYERVQESRDKDEKLVRQWVIPPEPGNTDLRQFRRSILLRGGPAATLAVTSNASPPRLTQLNVGYANSWAGGNPLRAERTYLPEEVPGVIRDVVATLVRDLYNREGDLHLTLAAPVIAGLPDPDFGWRAVTDYILSQPDLRSLVTMVTDRETWSGNERHTQTVVLPLPGEVRAALRLPDVPDPQGSWLRGELARPVDISGPQQAQHEENPVPGHAAPHRDARDAATRLLRQLGYLEVVPRASVDSGDNAVFIDEVAWALQERGAAEAGIVAEEGARKRGRLGQVVWTARPAGELSGADPEGPLSRPLVAGTRPGDQVPVPGRVTARAGRGGGPSAQGGRRLSPALPLRPGELDFLETRVNVALAQRGMPPVLREAVALAHDQLGVRERGLPLGERVAPVVARLREVAQSGQPVVVPFAAKNDEVTGPGLDAAAVFARWLAGEARRRVDERQPGLLLRAEGGGNGGRWRSDGAWAVGRRRAEAVLGVLRSEVRRELAGLDVPQGMVEFAEPASRGDDSTSAAGVHGLQSEDQRRQVLAWADLGVPGAEWLRGMTRAAQADLALRGFEGQVTDARVRSVFEEMRFSGGMRRVVESGTAGHLVAAAIAAGTGAALAGPSRRAARGLAGPSGPVRVANANTDDAMARGIRLALAQRASKKPGVGPSDKARARLLDAQRAYTRGSQAKEDAAPSRSASPASEKAPGSRGATWDPAPGHAMAGVPATGSVSDSTHPGRSREPGPVPGPDAVTPQRAQADSPVTDRLAWAPDRQQAETASVPLPDDVRAALGVPDVPDGQITEGTWILGELARPTEISEARQALHGENPVSVRANHGKLAAPDPDARSAPIRRVTGPKSKPGAAYERPALRLRGGSSSRFESFTGLVSQARNGIPRPGGHAREDGARGWRRAADPRGESSSPVTPATRHTGTWAEVVRLLEGRRINVGADGLEEMAGPDVFGVRQPRPVPEFLAGYRYENLHAVYRAAFFRELDMVRAGVPRRERLAPRGLDSGPASEGRIVRARGRLGLKLGKVPHVGHAIWLGGMLPEPERANLQTARHRNPGFEFVLWTDVTRKEINTVRTADPAELSGRPAAVRALLDWARAASVRLVNVDEVFNGEHPALLGGQLGTERGRAYPAGWAQASDLLRVEILHRFGGVYSDPDNSLSDRLPEAAEAAARAPSGIALGRYRKTSVVSNALIGAVAGGKGIEHYRQVLQERYAVPFTDLMTQDSRSEPPTTDKRDDINQTGEDFLRQEVQRRTGPNPVTFDALARRLGIELGSPRHQLPRVPDDVFDLGQAHAWLPGRTDTMAGAPPAGPGEIADAVLGAVVSLHRETGNRNQGVWLPAAARVISRLPGSSREVAWHITLRYLHDTLRDPARVRWISAGDMDLPHSVQDYISRLFPGAPQVRFRVPEPPADAGVRARVFRVRVPDVPNATRQALAGRLRDALKAGDPVTTSKVRQLLGRLDSLQAALGRPLEPVSTGRPDNRMPPVPSRPEAGLPDADVRRASTASAHATGSAGQVVRVEMSHADPGLDALQQKAAPGRDPGSRAAAIAEVLRFRADGTGRRVNLSDLATQDQLDAIARRGGLASLDAVEALADWIAAAFMDPADGPDGPPGDVALTLAIPAGRTPDSITSGGQIVQAVATKLRHPVFMHLEETGVEFKICW
jgi:hypothetical protein